MLEKVRSSAIAARGALAHFYLGAGAGRASGGRRETPLTRRWDPRRRRLMMLRIKAQASREAAHPSWIPFLCRSRCRWLPPAATSTGRTRLLLVAVKGERSILRAVGVCAALQSRTLMLWWVDFTTRFICSRRPAPRSRAGRSPSRSAICCGRKARCSTVQEGAARRVGRRLDRLPPRRLYVLGAAILAKVMRSTT
jgi:hypothetical protein